MHKKFPHRKLEDRCSYPPFKKAVPAAPDHRVESVNVRCGKIFLPAHRKVRGAVCEWPRYRAPIRSSNYRSSGFSLTPSNYCEGTCSNGWTAENGPRSIHRYRERDILTQ